MYFKMKTFGSDPGTWLDVLFFGLIGVNNLKTDILHWPVYLGNNKIFFTVQHV